MERSAFKTEINVPGTVARLADDDQARACNARTAIEFACYNVKNPARQAEKASLARALAAELAATVQTEEPKDKKKAKDQGATRPKHPAGVRDLLLQYLALVGTQEQVPVIAGLLGDLELRESARRALQQIPGAASANALVEAFPKAAGSEFRIGLINALACRGGGNSLAVFRQVAGDADPGVRMAAIDALARWGGASDDRLMVDAIKAGACCASVCAARVRLAANLAQQGDTVAAHGIYTAVAAMKSCKGPARAARLALTTK